ncbi:hypothetical protein QQ054_16810 [Oscillatoria amoena NRMC-F 0135]|nr:hypothetical protein [Oscillatoria amoena NRMC-F 0135]
MRLLLFTISLFAYCALKSQPATVRFENELKANVVVIKVTDLQLFTQTSTYSLKEIRSVSFWDEEPDSVSMHTIRANGVTVYLKNKRYAPIEEPKEFVEYTSNGSIGFGIGLEYGGFGTKLALGTARPVGLFVGLGYNLDRLGYNAGLDFKFTPRKSTTVYITAMYGYNGVIIYEGGGPDKTYYGFSVGMGVKLTGKYRQKNYTSLSFLVPFRDQEFIDVAKSNNQFIMPVLFSLGYNLGF